ncbi:hypothetical protein BB561_002567 [Smittium simulii]|uniref:Uncharacterized protein n=1 Tax=Smittium simulii TaxID=133385 RepID=A0A2T9YPX4_9FUNG|nr:hypothetical protein BB561_002567 [Smittium simulii]
MSSANDSLPIIISDTNPPLARTANSTKKPKVNRKPKKSTPNASLTELFQKKKSKLDSLSNKLKNSPDDSISILTNCELQSTKPCSTEGLTGKTSNDDNSLLFLLSNKAFSKQGSTSKQNKAHVKKAQHTSNIYDMTRQNDVPDSFEHFLVKKIHFKSFSENIISNSTTDSLHISTTASNSALKIRKLQKSTKCHSLPTKKNTATKINKPPKTSRAQLLFEKKSNINLPNDNSLKIPIEQNTALPNNRLKSLKNLRDNTSYDVDTSYKSVPDASNIVACANIKSNKNITVNPPPLELNTNLNSTKSTEDLPYFFLPTHKKKQILLKSKNEFQENERAKKKKLSKNKFVGDIENIRVITDKDRIKFAEMNRNNTLECELPWPGQIFGTNEHVMSTNTTSSIKTGFTDCSIKNTLYDHVQSSNIFSSCEKYSYDKLNSFQRQLY